MSQGSRREGRYSEPDVYLLQMSRPYDPVPRKSQVKPSSQIIAWEEGSIPNSNVGTLSIYNPFCPPKEETFFNSFP